MICDNCGKNEVEVLIKQVLNQQIRNLKLCRYCAEELGFTSPVMPSITISFSLEDGSQKKRKVRKQPLPRRKDQLSDSHCCSVCDTKFSSFREEGLLGCPKCYEEFRVPLGAFLQKTQGSESHWIASDIFKDISIITGNGEFETDDAGNAEDITRLRLEMYDAVAREDYERAAELRDILAPLVGESRRKND